MDLRRSKIVVAIVIVVFVAGLILTINRSDRSRDLVLSLEPIDPSDEVTVYVGGAVEAPGLLHLPRGSRVAEALDIAGLLETADTSGVQLASVLRDEQSIIVPEQTRERDSSADERQSQSRSQGELIDINQATDAQLQELPGIGPSLAARIRERRNLEGPFQSLDQLSEISGISDRMVDEIRDLATAGQ